MAKLTDWARILLDVGIELHIDLGYTANLEERKSLDPQIWAIKRKRLDPQTSALLGPPIVKIDRPLRLMKLPANVLQLVLLHAGLGFEEK